MLSVSFNLAQVAAMLIGIVLPGNPKEVDSLNSPTTRPIPSGVSEVGIDTPFFKGWLAFYRSLLQSNKFLILWRPANAPTS
jgi:hypothetical protein